MKKINFLFLAFVLGNSIANAQPCSTGRYARDVYDSVKVTSTIPYGANITYSGSPESLTLDFYEPFADTAKARPLIILAHGGSFTSGSSTDFACVALGDSLAKMGYTCASINYRLGISPYDSIGAVYAVIRAVQDMKASVRFFYKDRMTANQFKIDTNNIFISGGSAGAITALHVAYLKRSCEISAYVDSTTLASMGGLEGHSGNPCFSEKVKGVINLSGALASYSMLEAGSAPLCSMHGTADPVVIYGRGECNPGIPIMWLDGSRLLHARAMAVGVSSSLYSFYGAGHVPFNGTSPAQLLYMDTTVKFIRDFLVGQLGCTNQALQPANPPYGTPILYPFTACTGNAPFNCAGAEGIETIKADLVYEVYPNPSTGNVNLVFTNNNAGHLVQLTDISGRILESEITSEGNFVLKRNSRTAGLYFLRVSDTGGEASVKKIIFVD